VDILIKASYSRNTIDRRHVNESREAQVPEGGDPTEISTALYDECKRLVDERVEAINAEVGNPKPGQAPPPGNPPATTSAPAPQVQGGGQDAIAAVAAGGQAGGPWRVCTTPWNSEYQFISRDVVTKEQLVAAIQSKLDADGNGQGVNIYDNRYDMEVNGKGGGSAANIKVAKDDPRYQYAAKGGVIARGHFSKRDGEPYVSYTKEFEQYLEAMKLAATMQSGPPQAPAPQAPPPEAPAPQASDQGNTPF